MKSVQHLLNKIVSTILVDDRCRKFADCIVDHYVDSGCDFAADFCASIPKQSPTTTNFAESFHSHLNADIKTRHPNMVSSITHTSTGLYLDIDWFSAIRASAF